MSLKDRLSKIESRTAKVVPMSDEDKEKLLQWVDEIIREVNEGAHKHHTRVVRPTPTGAVIEDAFLDGIINGYKQKELKDKAG